MPEISRRTLLVGAATVPIALTLPGPVACATPARKQPFPTNACGNLGNTRVCVSAQQVLDVTGLQYHITNNGDTTASYTVSYTDMEGGPESEPRTVSVEPGETAIGDFYGNLQTCFTLHTCRTGGDCIDLGPVCAEFVSGV
ncbi:hypothetical protein ACWD4J_40650 [Streptomyces sp. NPDC002577]